MGIRNDCAFDEGHSYRAQHNDPAEVHGLSGQRHRLDVLGASLGTVRHLEAVEDPGSLSDSVCTVETSTGGVTHGEEVAVGLVQGNAVEAVNPSASDLPGTENGTGGSELKDASIARSLGSDTIHSATAHAHGEHVAAGIHCEVAQVIGSGGSKHFGPKRSHSSGIADRILSNEEIESSNSTSTNSSVAVASDVQLPVNFLGPSGEHGFGGKSVEIRWIGRERSSRADEEKTFTDEKSEE